MVDGVKFVFMCGKEDAMKRNCIILFMVIILLISACSTTISDSVMGISSPTAAVKATATRMFIHHTPRPTLAITRVPIPTPTKLGDR
jgi:hypothetical protein